MWIYGIIRTLSILLRDAKKADLPPLRLTARFRKNGNFSHPSPAILLSPSLPLFFHISVDSFFMGQIHFLYSAGGVDVDGEESDRDRERG